MAPKYEQKKYYIEESCVFKKTKELYGGLSNMASGFTLNINDIQILTSEALYQACRFPHLPEVQQKIIIEKSPMSAKMVCKPFRKNSRVDWDKCRINIMRWCLKIKLAQNFSEFGELLKSTGDKFIVEESSKDDFWGAIRDKNHQDILTGTNALGRLLMELRQFYFDCLTSNSPIVIEPLNILDFKLYGEAIKSVEFNPQEESKKHKIISSNTKEIKDIGIQGKLEL